MLSQFHFQSRFKYCTIEIVSITSIKAIPDVTGHIYRQIVVDYFGKRWYYKSIN